MQDSKIDYTPNGKPIWPFPSVNGQQTEESKALQADKDAHRPVPYDLNQCEDALL